MCVRWYCRYGISYRDLEEMMGERGVAVGLLPKDTRHRQVKYLNNRLEGDHGKLKRLIKPTLGFQSMKTAYATIKGFEVMRMFRKGQFKHWIEAVGGGTEASPLGSPPRIHLAPSRSWRSVMRAPW